MSRNTLIVLTAISSLIVGGVAGVWLVRSNLVQLPGPQDLTPAASAPPAMPAGIPMPEKAAEPEIFVVIPQDALERMHLEYADVKEEIVTSEVRVPGTVQPNAYRDVRVTSLVGGVATKISAELGQTIKRGQSIAQLFSRDLAEAQSEFVGFQAQLEAEHKKLVRTQELLRLGAASREELETVEASHQMHTAHLEEARQRLLLFGLTEEQIDDVREGRKVSSDITIAAPSDGIVTARSVNLGQVVGASQELFTITDLSSVWVEGNLLEDNFSTVRVGSAASITSPAYAGRTYRGVVEYVDPRVDPQTRTAKVRVSVDNKDLALKLGMYLDISFLRAGAKMATVPAQAVQMIGSKSVVYVPVEDQPGRFQQRTIAQGTESSAGRRSVEGVHPPERVVTEGSFLVRAETLRQHPQ